jgi:hypothetical protein
MENYMKKKELEKIKEQIQKNEKKEKILEEINKILNRIK